MPKKKENLEKTKVEPKKKKDWLKILREEVRKELKRSDDATAEAIAKEEAQERQKAKWRKEHEQKRRKEYKKRQSIV